MASIFVEGDDPKLMHPAMAKAMDEAIEEIKAIQKNARENNDPSLPAWPVIIFRAPKGWTGPKEWNGEPIEKSFRAHQIPIPVDQKICNTLMLWLTGLKVINLKNYSMKMVS